MEKESIVMVSETLSLLSFFASLLTGHFLSLNPESVVAASVFIYSGGVLLSLFLRCRWKIFSGVKM